MSADLVAVFLSAKVGMILFFLLHLSIWMGMPSNQPRILLLSFLWGAGAVFSLAVYNCFFQANGIGVVSIIWIDFFTLVAYLFVYAGVARSVSLTLLSKLASAPDGTRSAPSLVDEYLLSQRFGDRIRLMRAAGLVEISGDTASLTGKGRLLALTAGSLGRLFGGQLQG